jgi:hypothetical protein
MKRNDFALNIMLTVIAIFLLLGIVFSDCVPSSCSQQRPISCTVVSLATTILIYLTFKAKYFYVRYFYLFWIFLGIITLVGLLNE